MWGGWIGRQVELQSGDCSKEGEGGTPATLISRTEIACQIGGGGGSKETPFPCLQRGHKNLPLPRESLAKLRRQGEPPRTGGRAG